ncbi:magnesium transporter CorA family protein [Deinococcus sp. Marseille-Q6407]|uniref:magnesium transporter CorA family protein n=1 Tax=Deinococcus sp. Marseille-Q6407 TaxID=2969223 RepID=UPI0021C1D6FF|nr:magnesium transporter CorA family protein [Deinococcus sp. Marseille-Q6407]
MLTYYRSVGGRLTTIDGYTDGCWINATDPTIEELARISRETGLDIDVLSYPLDPDERSRFEREDGELLVIMQTSYRLPEDSDIPYDTVPLGILHTDHCLVTICAIENPLIRDVVSGFVRRISTSKKNRLTLQLFLRNAQRFLIDIRQINRDVEQIEDRLENSTRNEELLDLLNFEKSMVYFITGLRANEAMMERAKRDRIFQTYEDDAELLDDVLIENLQAIEMATITSNILGSMMGAFGSVISNNVNQVMKTLTVVSAIFLPLTFMAGIWGMNFEYMPELHQRWGYGAALGSMALVALGMFWFFRRRGWW